VADIDVPVLIVGGGPVGLCTSLLLSRFGVSSLLVERHPATGTWRGDRLRLSQNRRLSWFALFMRSLA
jgi:2-polyprenyl-6-methoxyphenol hydroxylase-like FAD-dependent oxidoreductase